jgi:lipid-A-disaccharide synthase
MKKIFILTGEPSGDKLASKVISKLQKNDPNIEYSCVGGTHLNSLGIQSIFELKDITYIGFTSVLLNIFKIKNKINKTVEEIIRFNPDVLFSVDSPDFTLRVAEKVKKLNNKIKTVHYVAPQVWIWREGRVKKIKKFLDHILLLFDFEKKYFDKESIPNTFVGHPLLEQESKNKIDLSSIISNDKKIISLFSGSRSSEVNILLPILIDFINMMNKKFDNFTFVFHATDENKSLISDKVKNTNLKNIEIISDENIKKQILNKSTFAVSKSGTVSLEICNAKVPSIIIYKMNFLNFLIVKMLLK